MPDELRTFIDNEWPRHRYDEHPISGRLWLGIDVPTVSLQGKKTARTAFEEKIHEETRKYKYLLSGDMTLSITLQVHQSHRYESDKSPDLDNFLKPLLDSLSGPSGILIDDCQVRSLCINWISWVRDDTRVELFFDFIEDEYVPKEGLMFVQINGPLCIPVNTSLSVQQQRYLLCAMQLSFRQRRRLQQLEWDYYASSSVLPIQRRFHRTRINGFPVKSVAEYRRELRRLMAKN